VNVVAVVATGVNAAGHREVLGGDIVTSEDGAGWETFLGQLVERGLNGVELVISDDHKGLKAALAKKLPGSSWQRCRAHFMRNVLTKVSKPAQDLVATLIRSVFAQPARDEVWAQLGRVVEQQLRSRFPKTAEALEDAAEDILAFTSFPRRYGGRSGRTTRRRD